MTNFPNGNFHFLTNYILNILICFLIWAKNKEKKWIYMHKILRFPAFSFHLHMWSGRGIWGWVCFLKVCSDKVRNIKGSFKYIITCLSHVNKIIWYMSWNYFLLNHYFFHYTLVFFNPQFSGKHLIYSCIFHSTKLNSSCAIFVQKKKRIN